MSRASRRVEKTPGAGLRVHCLVARSGLRVVLLLGLAWGAAVGAHGQKLAHEEGQPFAQSMSLGARMGYGFNSIAFRPHQATKQGKALEAGLYVALRSNRYLALVLEPGLRRTTYTSEYPIPHSNLEESAPPYTAQQDWLYLPMLLEGRFHLAWISLIASAGPFADYLLRESVRAATGGGIPQALHSTQRNRLGLGLIGGLGLGVNTRWGSIVIEYRAGYRLTNLYLMERIPKLEEPRSNLTNQSVSVSYYYTIAFRQATE